MNEIFAASSIDPAALDGENYLQSLLAAGVFSEPERERIQLGCLTLLAERAAAYTNGRSGSVREEIAQSLLASVFYTIGLYLKTQTPDRAIELLKSQPVDLLYQKGRARIDILLRSAKTLYREAEKNRFPVENSFYRAALGGLKNFFKTYDPNFAAQESGFLPEYPLDRPVQNQVGIELIQSYLEALCFESRFVRCFSPDEVRQLFSPADAEAPVNLYRPVLKAAVCGYLATGTVGIRMNERDRLTLSGLLRDRSAVSDAFDPIAAHCNIESERYRRYVWKTLLSLAQEIVG